MLSSPELPAKSPGQTIVEVSATISPFPAHGLRSFDGAIVVEIPHRDDPMVGRLLANKAEQQHDDDDLDTFVAAFTALFDVKGRETVPGGTRTLFHLVPARWQTQPLAPLAVKSSPRIHTPTNDEEARPSAPRPATPAPDDAAHLHQPRRTRQHPPPK